MRALLAAFALLLTTHLVSAQERWTAQRANAWYKQERWPVGCNFIPSTAINQLEMWQDDTFDPTTIDRELGWAEDLGFTSVRVFLHDLPWQQDSKGFVQRIDRFMDIAEKHKIKVMFVLLDSCWHPEPKAGKQPQPTPFVHNSGWVQSPGVAVLKDAEKFKALEGYVTGIVRRYGRDSRVLAWDLWNEPENNNGSSYGKFDLKDKEKIVLPLVKDVFAWARSAKPHQPVTAAPWIGDWTDENKLSDLNRFLFENSDIITFHRYENLAATKKQADALKRYQRPILCTEYMARQAGSTFEAILPCFREQNIGAYCWGFVAGKSQTIYPWDSWQKKYDAEPSVWFHDIFRPNGKPFDEKEIKAITKVTGADVSVKLRFSVEVLDPVKPDKSFVECTVRNGSDKAIAVPSRYSGGWGSDMILNAWQGVDNRPGGGNMFRHLTLVKWAADKKKETRPLEPGQETTIFKDELAKVLLLDGFKINPLIPKEERYYWSWQA